MYGMGLNSGDRMSERSSERLVCIPLFCERGYIERFRELQPFGLDRPMYGMGLNGVDRMSERFCVRLVCIPRFCELGRIQHFHELEQCNDGLECVKFPLLCCKRDSPMVLSRQTWLLELERIHDDWNVLCMLNVQEHR